jgi:hypothetical protein
VTLPSASSAGAAPRRTVGEVLTFLQEALTSADLLDAVRFGDEQGIEPVTLLTTHLASPLQNSPLPPLGDLFRTRYGDERRAFERWLLGAAAVQRLELIERLPVVESVKQLLLAEICLYVSPPRRTVSLLSVGAYSFDVAAMVALLRRMPAGQYHWETTGLSRRYLLQVAKPRLPRALWTVYGQMGGHSPVIFPHVNPYRRNPFVWLEAESNRSFHRMARSMELQPNVRGLVTRAWLHDPGLAAISPHLAWTNRVFLENGGVVLANGSALDEPASRENSKERQQAFDEGRYDPQFGLVLWPRRAMIRWAAQHPELGD